MTFKNTMLAGALLCSLALPTVSRTADAQAAPAGVSAATMQYVQDVATACKTSWDAPECLKAVSASNLVLAANYAAALQQSGHAAQSEDIKQHCAASTAATKGSYPAYALKSAFAECANIIVDTQQATGVAPDATQFQLLTVATCSAEDPRCVGMKQKLAQYAK